MDSAGWLAHGLVTQTGQTPDFLDDAGERGDRAKRFRSTIFRGVSRNLRFLPRCARVAILQPERLQYL
jgi:hypothetical protein